MKPPLLSAYAMMLPRLMAEEALQHVAERHAASADVKPAYRERLVQAWQRQAAGEPERASRPTDAQLRGQMAALGIRVVASKSAGKEVTQDG